MALTFLRNILVNNCKEVHAAVFLQTKGIYTNSPDQAWRSKDVDDKSEGKWLKYNEKIYPPQSPGEEPRPAYVCHERKNIKYSPKKMWYIASFIRGMSVDEAIRQLKFVVKKGAKDVREVLEEAKELAAKDHNVEFPSNMWVAESFCGKGVVVKGIRRHARGRNGKVEYKYVHYYVRLEEGTPPKHYYLPYPKEPHEQLEEWLENMRKRKIMNSL